MLGLAGLGDRLALGDRLLLGTGLPAGCHINRPGSHRSSHVVLSSDAESINLPFRTTEIRTANCERMAAGLASSLQSLILILPWEQLCNIGVRIMDMRSTPVHKVRCPAHNQGPFIKPISGFEWQDILWHAARKSNALTIPQRQLQPFPNMR
jgi:hypothetical protein